MFSRIASELRFRVRALLRSGDMDLALNAELQDHIEREVEKLLNAGMPRHEAERVARARFGGMARIADDARDERGISALENALQDIRYAIRGLRARKMFTAGVVVTLALGIGANATMFGIVDRLLFRAPPTLRDQGTAHRIYRHAWRGNEQRVDRNFPFPAYVDVATLARSFSDVAAFQTRMLAIDMGDDAREVPVTVATASFFNFFAARPVLGRFFTAADDSVPAGAPVVVLGHAFWQAHYGGRDVLGERLLVDRTPMTIVGVAPKGFVGMSDQGVPAAYIPMSHYAFVTLGSPYVQQYGVSWLEMLARRRPDVSVRAAETDLAAAFVQSWRKMAAMNPALRRAEDAGIRAELTPVQLNRGPQAGRDSRVAAWVGGVAIIVLLIACANVANLLLLRAVSRRREVAVRLALGVTRGRLTRQLLTENVLLALLGGAGGLVVAQWGASALRAWFLTDDAHTGAITDMRTLVFCAAVSVGVALVTGLAPALHAGRLDVARALKAGARDGGAQHARARGALLVVQVALSAVLLVGAGLFVRSLGNAHGYRLGYDADGVVYAAMTMRGVSLTPAERAAMNDRILAAAQAHPGVSQAALAFAVPFVNNQESNLFVAGVDSVARLGRFLLQAGSPDYFGVMGTRIIKGRGFDASDGGGAPAVAIVSEGMARTLWPGRDAIGQCMRIGVDTLPCTTVVGVAEEMRLRSFVDDREFAYYIPAAQAPEAFASRLMVRVDDRVDEAALISSLRRRLQQELPGAAYANVVPLRTRIDPNLRSWKIGATMFTAFGALALILAAIGLYSLIAYDVAQRRRDLGVRVALGASVSRIVRLVVARGVGLVVAGLVIGAGAALWAAPWLQPLLFRQSTRDPVVFGAVAAMLVVIGLVATAAPALRAARVDPNTVLRDE